MSIHRVMVVIQSPLMRFSRCHVFLFSSMIAFIGGFVSRCVSRSSGPKMLVSLLLVVKSRVIVVFATVPFRVTLEVPSVRSIDRLAA